MSYICIRLLIAIAGLLIYGLVITLVTKGVEWLWKKSVGFLAYLESLRNIKK